MFVREVQPKPNLLTAFALTVLGTLGMGVPIAVAIIWYLFLNDAVLRRALSQGHRLYSLGLLRAALGGSVHRAIRDMPSLVAAGGFSPDYRQSKMYQICLMARLRIDADRPSKSDLVEYDTDSLSGGT